MRQAENTFRAAAEAGVTENWLNLAILLANEHDAGRAQTAAKHFCKRETNPVRTELVEAAISLDSTPNPETK